MSDEDLRGLARDRDANPDDFVAFRKWRHAHHRAGGEGPDLAAEAKRLAVRWFVLSVRHERMRGYRGERAREIETRVLVERDTILLRFWRAYRRAGSYMQPTSMLDQMCAAAIEPQFEYAIDSLFFVRRTDGAWAILSALKAAPPFLARRLYWREQRRRDANFRRQTDGDRAMLDETIRASMGEMVSRLDPRMRAAVAGYTELPERSHQYGCDVCGAPSTFYQSMESGVTLYRCGTHANDTNRERPIDPPVFALPDRRTPVIVTHEGRPDAVAPGSCLACGGTGMGDYPYACNVCGGPARTR